MARFNLESPSTLQAPCCLDDLDGWFCEEVTAVGDSGLEPLLLDLVRNLDAVVRWPKHALLLWRGCDRTKPPDRPRRYHRFPDTIKAAAKECAIPLDTRPNGPAIAAFLLAGGERPPRYGSQNRWSIHHVYSGKFPYPGRSQTLHATKSGLHFTQSAGLVAVHPLIDAAMDEYPFVAWLMRAEAYRRFGYDPDGVFASNVTERGFAEGWKTPVFCEDEPG